MGKGLDQLEDLKDNGIRYLKLKWISLRLTAVENISTLLSRAFGYVIFLILLLIAFAFLMVGLALWLGEVLGHPAFGFLIAGGIFLIAGVIVYFIRGKLMINTFIRSFIDLLFTSEHGGNEQKR